MKSQSRIKNATLNIIVGILSQIGILTLSFVGRSVFVRFLDSDYLGINGLYGNILSVLALAELGVGNVTQFYLYRPVAENNQVLITSLVRFFQKIYFIISIVIFGMGILIIPILKYIVNSNLSSTELIVYYILFLINSVISYFSAHNVALLAAYQDTRLQKYVMLLVNFLTQILQIVFLMLCHSYVIYVCIVVLMTLVNVLIINYSADKKYTYLKKVKPQKVPLECKYGIIDKIKSTFIYKIGATIVNNTDNILISIMISTAAVGLYSNYWMVVTGVQGFIAIITTALIPGIGNLSTSGDKQRMKTVFDVMVWFYQIVATFGSISFYFLFNEFIPIWLGSQFVLDKYTVFAIAFGFYLTNAISPIWMFREANGLFNKVKYLLLCTAFTNIILSIILGHYFGMAGILFATSIARIVTQVWYEPHILFQNIFGVSSKYYWIHQIKYFIMSVISIIVCYQVVALLPCGFVWILVKAVSFALITVVIFGVGSCKNKVIKDIVNILRKNVIRRN